MPAKEPSRRTTFATPARAYFIMNRLGTFRPAEMTLNQCKEPGWPEYGYTLRMVFEGSMKLDKNDFIIDHAEVHKLVQELGLKGSCEDMTLRILTALDAFMTKRGIPMVACRCVVRPTDPNAQAWMERVHIASRAHVEALRLLQ